MDTRILHRPHARSQTIWPNRFHVCNIACGESMNLWRQLKAAWRRTTAPRHLRYGKLGERAAQKHLQALGLKFLTANYTCRRGEIDLVFRDHACLVFVEVKTRSDESWIRPAAAVNARKRRLLSLTAMDYLRRIKQPQVPIRFDIVEVLLVDGTVGEVRHIANAFSLTPPYRYG